MLAAARETLSGTHAPPAEHSENPPAQSAVAEQCVLQDVAFAHPKPPGHAVPVVSLPCKSTPSRQTVGRKHADPSALHIIVGSTQSAALTQCARQLVLSAQVRPPAHGCATLPPLWHEADVPLHCPALVRMPFAQAPLLQALPAAFASQRPGWVPLHVWHTPEQDVSQQMPWAQFWASAQSFAVMQVPPFNEVVSLPSSQKAPRWVRIRTRWVVGSESNRNGQYRLFTSSSSDRKLVVGLPPQSVLVAGSECALITRCSGESSSYGCGYTRFGGGSGPPGPMSSMLPGAPTGSAP